MSKALAFDLLLAALIAVGLLLTAEPAHAKTFTVTNTNDTGADSLRQALEDANARVGADTITFNIPGSGPHGISSTGGLPQITDPLTINGYSQPSSKPNSLAIGNNAVLKVELNGNPAGVGADGLMIAASDTTIKGLVIISWGQAVRISGSEATNKERKATSSAPTPRASKLWATALALHLKRRI